MRISDWSSDVCSSDLHGRSPLERLWKAGRLFPQPVPPLSAHADFLRLLGPMLLLPFPCSATDSSRSIGARRRFTSSTKYPQLTSCCCPVVAKHFGVLADTSTHLGTFQAVPTSARAVQM